jgi:hypothetical protein
MSLKRHIVAFLIIGIASAGTVSAVSTPILPVISAGVFKITDYGAVADGPTDNGAAIKKAISAASTAGGGTVLVPCSFQSIYISGPIGMMSSRVDVLLSVHQFHVPVGHQLFDNT